MPTPTESLGGRLPLTDPAGLTDLQRDLFDHMMSTWVPWARRAQFQSQTDDGRLIGPFNPVLLSPIIARSFLALQEVEASQSALSPRLREVIILAVGSVWQADYELYAHAAVARQAGLSEDAIAALMAGAPAKGLNDTEAIAQRFALQLSADHHVTDALYRDAQQALGSESVADMVFLIGIYHCVCGLLSAFAVPAPASPTAVLQPSGAHHDPHDAIDTDADHGRQLS